MSKKICLARSLKPSSGGGMECFCSGINLYEIEDINCSVARPGGWSMYRIHHSVSVTRQPLCPGLELLPSIRPYTTSLSILSPDGNGGKLRSARKPSRIPILYRLCFLATCMFGEMEVKSLKLQKI